MNYLKIILAILTILIISYNIINNVTKMTEPSHKDTEHQVTSITKDSAIIRWESQSKERSNIEYGIMQNVYYKSTAETDATHTHKIKLDFLEECTKYYYHVSSETMLFDNEKSYFTTLCDSNKTKKEEINE